MLKDPPWSKPPLTILGDADEEITFAGVGRAIDAWERLEFALARLYSVFVGDPDGDALGGYGAGRIFRDRLAILSKAADAYFVRHSSQMLERAFHEISFVAEGFSERRNDVAHGTVFKINALQFFLDRMPLAERNRVHFAVVPPVHTIRQLDAGGLPKYAYAASDLLKLSQMFSQLQLDTEQFRRHLLGMAPLS